MTRRSLLVLGLAVVCAGAASAQSVPQSFPAETSHMTVVARLPLTSGGEGYAMKMDGRRRLLYVAHESGPHCVTIADVTDPARPAVVRVLDVPAPLVRCNSLDVNGNVLAIAAEVPKHGDPGGGVRFYRLDDPASPKLAGYFDTTGPSSRGAHHVWLSSETLAHVTAGANDFAPGRERDDQFYRIVDISDLAHPKEAGRWTYPGQRAGDPGAPMRPIPQGNLSDNGIRPHNVDVFPVRPTRAYLGYIDGGLVILDIADVSHPKTLSIVSYAGPFTHTAWPIFSRNLLVTSEEDTEDRCVVEPKRVLVWDIADETKPRLMTHVPYPADSFDLCKRGGRFGPHNIYENKPYGPTFKSDRWLFTSWFGGGVRIYDLADPAHPKEAAYYVPPTPADSPKHAPQINDVFVDDRGIIYAGDRFTGGLWILRSDLIGSR